MFPLPADLPRNGVDHLMSPSLSSPLPETPDPVLDLLSPLFSSANTLAAKQARDVRIRLQEGVERNKSRAHDLLTCNFPSVSSNIRLGNELRSNFLKLRGAVTELERDIDPADDEASFLPPLLSLLSRHFSARETRFRSQTHAAALRSLQAHVEGLEKVEEAVYAGRGADDWVITELEKGSATMEGSELLLNTKVAKAADAKFRLFRSMVIEQITDGYGKALSITSPSVDQHGTSINVQARTSLQRPRIPRPEDTGVSMKASIPPPYSLSHIYDVLARLGVLSTLLQSLHTRLMREIILPVVAQSWRVEVSRADTSSVLRLQATSHQRSPTDVLSDLSTIMTFITTTVFPPTKNAMADHDSFCSTLQTACLQAVLDHVIMAAMPPTMASVSSWLNTIQAAVDFEASLIEPVLARAVILPFFSSKAGLAWASQRRRRVAEEVRRLILNGWGGWEAVEAEREKEVMIMVEVEVVDEAEDPSQVDAAADTEKTDFEWSIDDERSRQRHESFDLGPTSKTAMNVDDEDDVIDDDVGDGWAFSDANASAGPSKPQQSPQSTVNGDGWDFEEVTNPAATPSESVVVRKPAREAKRLGKKVAKAKSVVEDDVWVPKAESTASGVLQNRHSPAVELVDEWGEWAENTAPTSQVDPSLPRSAAKPRRKELQEERRTIKESFLISRACGKLLEITERVLREAYDTRSTQSISPSFASSDSILTASATDIFDIYRSLVPVRFAMQLRDVPAVAMQLYNDSVHLSSCVMKLRETFQWWDAAEDISKRLKAVGELVFEEQLAAQREALMGVLDDAGGFSETADEGSFKRCERAVRQVQHNLETLARTLQAVLPTTTFISVLGYLLDTAVQRISSDILGLADVTEIESDRLHHLVKLLQPLEALFVLEKDQPSTIVSQVPHWLKFCYIAELLQANLVDITYLFDTGALVDFSTAELVGLLRALFADSEKRDAAIERIENGLVFAVRKEEAAT